MTIKSWLGNLGDRIYSHRKRSGFIYSWFGTDGEPDTGNQNAAADHTYTINQASTIIGYVDQIQIFARGNGTLDFGVFSKSGNNFTDKHCIQGLSVVVGLNTFTAPSDFSATALPITVGDYIGVHSTIGWARNTLDGPGAFYCTGDQIGNESAALYTTHGTATLDLHLRAKIRK